MQEYSYRNTCDVTRIYDCMSEGVYLSILLDDEEEFVQAPDCSEIEPSTMLGYEEQVKEDPDPGSRLRQSGRGA